MLRFPSVYPPSARVPGIETFVQSRVIGAAVMIAGGGGPDMAGMAPSAGPRARPSLRKAVAVFANRNYRFLWSSSLTAFIAMHMQMVAGSWLAWDLSGSFAVVGLMAMAMGLPMLLFSLVGGAIADRVNKRNLTAGTQVFPFIFSFTVAILVLTGLISIPILVAFGLVQGTAFAFGMPARQPLMIQVVGREHMLSAMALGSAAMNATRLIGPALAGLLISLQGVELSYFVQSGFSALSVLLLLAIPASLGRATPAGPGMQRGGIAQEIGRGLRYVAGHKTLRLLLMMAFIPALFAMPYQMLLAGFVEGDLERGAGAFGLLQTMAGVGALVGSIMVASLVDFPRKPLIQLCAGLLAALGLVSLGITTLWWGYPAALAAVLLLGITLASYQTLNMAMLMSAADEAYYGRVMSIMMLSFSVMPLMAAPLGLMADVVGTTNLFVGQGIAVGSLLIIVSLANPRYIFGRVEPPPSQAESAAVLEGEPAPAGRPPR